MNSIYMKLTDLVRPEKNIRIHTEQQLREFERSVKMFGQIRPIVVDENNVILAGNGLYETLLRLDYEEALVYQYTDLTENQKKKLMIADNKIFSLGIENLDTLNAFLEELQDDLDIPGYDSEILQQMIADAEDVTEKTQDFDFMKKIRKLSGERRFSTGHAHAVQNSLPFFQKRENLFPGIFRLCIRFHNKRAILAERAAEVATAKKNGAGNTARVIQ